MPSDFIQHRLRFAVRGPEVGFALAKGDSSALEEICRLCCEFWNGANSLLIPVEADGSLNPDLGRLRKAREIETCYLHPSVLPSAAGPLRESLGTVNVVPLSKYSDLGRFIHPLNLQPSYQRSSFGATHPNLLEPVYTGEGPRRVALCAWGAILAEDRSEYEKSFTLESRTGDDADPALLLGQIDGTSPLSQSIQLMGPYHQTAPFDWRTLVIFQDGSFDELVLFWNLRARSARWGDETKVVGMHVDGLRSPGVFEPIQEWLKHTHGSHAKPDLLVLAPERAIDQVSTILDAFGLTRRPPGAKLTHSFPDPPQGREGLEYDLIDQAYFGEEMRRGFHGEELVVLREGKNSVSLRTGPRFQFRHGGSVRVDLLDLPLPFPVRTERAANRIITNGRPTPGGVRIQIGVASTYNLSICLPTKDESLSDYLASFGATGELSADGGYASALLGRLGSLADLDSLASDHAVKVIDVLTPVSRVKLADRLVNRLTEIGLDREQVETQLADTLRDTLLVLEPRTLILNDIKSRTRLSKKQVGSVLELLIRAGLVRRGYVARCSLCGYADFYSLDSATEWLECRACKMSFLLAPFSSDLSSELAVSYQLDGLMARAMDQDLLPVLLTVRYMLKKGLIEPETPMWPGINITGSPVGDIEIDILAGRGDLTLVAECKKTASWLSTGQAERLVRLSREMSARPCFAALQGRFSAEVMAIAAQANAFVADGSELFLP